MKGGVTNLLVVIGKKTCLKRIEPLLLKLKILIFFLIVLTELLEIVVVWEAFLVSFMPLEVRFRFRNPNHGFHH